jgi:hypothetical protein
MPDLMKNEIAGGQILQNKIPPTASVFPQALVQKRKSG